MMWKIIDFIRIFEIFRNISNLVNIVFENFPFWSQSLEDLNFSHNSWTKYVTVSEKSRF